MNVYNVVTTQLQTNTYIVTNGTRAFVVDPGGDYVKIKEKVNELGVNVEAVLLTHGHFDHTNAALFFQQQGALVFCHHNDISKLTTFKGGAFTMNVTQNKVIADIALSGEETINVAGLNVEVIWTPGHSSGSVCYIVEKNIFCGDTVFYMSYGRTDFYDGSQIEIKNSILNKLFMLTGDYIMYTGHGESTSLEFEKKHNEIIFN
ncbi:MAG: MBL fold metallo-hydrolase [Clostridia bacterium]|nr:MBL fold metallo-hydrolase [Clostridia bacterium]